MDIGGLFRPLARRPLSSVGALALVLQLASATWWLKPYVMPNAAFVIASNLAASGRYEGGSWVRLKGIERPTDPPLRSYHLPGEPLYLAAGLALHRPALFTYWHVPVAVALVVATAAMALALFGPAAALAAGTIAALDPLMVVHGPVYDDTFLAAALLWIVAAIAIGRWTHRGSDRPGTRRLGEAGTTIVLAAVSAWAAVTRTETSLALAGAALCCCLLPALRPLRRVGLAMALGVALGLGAWGARNAVVQHHLLLGSTHDGVTLWESTEPEAGRALALGQVDALSTDPAVVGAVWRQTIDQDEATANRIFTRAALQDIAADPVRVAAFGARKVALSFIGLRPELSRSAARNVVSIGTTVLLVLAAAVGLARMRGRRDADRRVAGGAAMLLGLEILAVLMLGPVGLRYWIAWRPVLWILAGCGAAWAWLPHDRRGMQEGDARVAPSLPFPGSPRPGTRKPAVSTSSHRQRQIPASSAAAPRSGGRAR